MTNNISIMVAITVFSISLSIIPAYAAIQFDQSTSFNANNRIIIDHSDIITFTGTTSPNPVIISINNGANPMPVTLVQIPGTDIWQKMVTFKTGCTNNPTALIYCVPSNGQVVTVTTNAGEKSSATISTSTSSSITYGTPTQVALRTCPTDPDGNSDSDDDGICDMWETGDLHIPSLTAGNPEYFFDCNPICNDDKKDIFIEIDYMTGHRPNAESIKAVKDAFANSPNDGINLQIQIDDNETGISHNLSTPFPGSSISKGFDQIKGAHFGTPDERASGWNDKLTLKRQVFHYFLFTHTQASSGSNSLLSGQSEVLGNDGIITLGSFDGKIGNPNQQSGTFMHELGHNLNLEHGGPPTDKINCKPNYLSVMSHSRQFADLVSDRSLDFSWQQLNSLKEDNLDENVGVSPLYSHKSSERVIYGPIVPTTLPTTNVAIDWNNNGVATNTGVKANINSIGTICTSASDTENLVGYNDWAYIDLKFKDASGTFSDGVSSSNPGQDRDEGIPCSSIPVDLRQQARAQWLNNNRACQGNEITSEHVREMRNIRIDQLKDMAKPLEESNPYLYSDIIGKYEDAKNLINNDELALAHQKLSEIDYSGIEDATIKEQLQGASNDVKSLFSHVKPEVSISRGPGASPQEGPAPEDLQAPEEAPPDDSGIITMIAGAAAAAAIGGGAYAVSRRGSGTKVNPQ